MRDTKNGTSRRDFLKLAGTGAPVAAVALAAGVQASGDQTGAPAPVDPTSVKMQDTAHTRAYYESARF